MKEFATVLYGSQNYGLDIESSDRDYKVLLCPSFQDYYYGHHVEKRDLPSVYDSMHYSPIDITRFHALLMHGNPNCMEMLFSTEWRIYNDNLKEYLDKARRLYSLGFLSHVWGDFFPALKGIVMNSLERYGASPKTVSRGYFMYNMMLHILDHGFTVDSSTFRGGIEFQRVARSIRTDKSIIGDIKSKPEVFVESAKTWFDDATTKTTTKAAEFCQQRSADETDEILNLCSQLNEDMRNIVARSIYDEIKEKVVHE